MDTTGCGLQILSTCLTARPHLAPVSRSESEFDGSNEGRTSKEDDPDAFELDALVAKLDANIGKEEISQSPSCRRTAWSVGDSDSEEPLQPRKCTGKARREYRKVAAAIQALHESSPIELAADSDGLPPMPTKEEAQQHRDELGVRFLPFNACVAKPVAKKEISEQPKAREVLKKKWDRLREKSVWDLNLAGVREWSKVAEEARMSGKEVHLGMLYEICVEKGSELAPEFRKYKGRVVFLGPSQEPKL